MPHNILILILACVWILSVPIGYLAARRANRAMASTWTHNDRISVIMLSLVCGPFMPFVAIMVLLIYKLDNSDWGKKEARW